MGKTCTYGNGKFGFWQIIISFSSCPESVENAPPGMRAKVTIEIKDENEFLETFNLAFPGKDYEEFLRNTWTRLKR